MDARVTGFIHALISDPKRNSCHAAIAVGYSPRSARTAGYRLMQRDDVKTAIDQADQKARKKTENKRQRMVAELENIIYGDPGELMAWGPAGVQIKQSKGLSLEQRRRVSEVTSRTTRDGIFVKVKCEPKLRAMELLARLQGWLVDRQEVGAPGEFANIMGAAMDGGFPEPSKEQPS